MIAAVHHEAGKQEMYLKQRPQKLEKFSFRGVDLTDKTSNNKKAAAIPVPEHSSAVIPVLSEACNSFKTLKRV
jgi:hypothetical protein